LEDHTAPVDNDASVLIAIFADFSEMADREFSGRAQWALAAALRGNVRRARVSLKGKAAHD